MVSGLHRCRWPRLGGRRSLLVSGVRCRSADATGRFAIPSGSELGARLDQAVSAGKDKLGEPFAATPMDALTVNGETVLAAGIRLTGQVLENRPAGI